MFAGSSRDSANMFSGNDTIEYPTQWALNPSAYQNVSNDQVDWAALAQQWIQMKESCPATPVPPAPLAPPPPIISVPVGEEGGEAPMEVEGNEADVPAAPVISPQQWKSVSGSSNWGNSWDQWSGNNQSNWGWQSGSSTKNTQVPPDPPGIGGYTTAESNFSGAGYWSTDDANDAPSGNANVPNSDSASSRVPRRPFRHHPASSTHITATDVDTTQTIDAAKRRQLPAWIREGLEKMEREKHKQLEREKEKKDREEYLKYKRLEEEQISQKDGQPNDTASQMPTKSKFDTDSDDSESDNKKIKKPVKDAPVRERVAIPPPLLRTQEEIMQDIMLCVRRSLTEILLEVTNEQILSVCQEELSRKRSQPQATRGVSVASKSQALSSIGGQLGLGIYGNSSGESDSEIDSEDGRRSSTPGERRRKPADMTDGQLQETIRRRKAEFEKTSREIEAQIASEESGHNKNHGSNDHRTSASVANEKSSRTGRGMGESASDGEDSTTHIRNEQNIVRQRKYSAERTPPLDFIKKSLTDGNAEKFVDRTAKNKSAEGGGNKYSESNSRSKSGSKHHKYDATKKEKPVSNKTVKKNKNNARDESSTRSSDSDSDSDSSAKKSVHSDDKQSGSNSDSSSSTRSSASSSSGSSVRGSKKHIKKKKKGSSEESKKSKKDKTKSSKSKKEKKSKHLKRSEKDNTNASESQSKKHDHDYKSDYSPRDSYSSARKSYTRTPDRKSYKSKYDRSRSRSSNAYDNHDRYYSSSTRHRSRERRDRSRERRESSRDDRYRVKDKRDRSRDGKERPKDEKDYYRDDRDRSRDRRDRSKERRDRDRRGDRREYSRSSRY
ncbi:uncharacterized protein LOC143914873 isoform X2 [Arctopsyche grandis]|uniref:uncharacterized protein LOC143914873 isoform X2 n=1 Tax=Arctopsyche grandis TaxID=121162 RepID=UPI00406D8966